MHCYAYTVLLSTTLNEIQEIMRSRALRCSFSIVLCGPFNCLAFPAALACLTALLNHHATPRFMALQARGSHVGGSPRGG